jgi:hypothetical protein
VGEVVAGGERGGVLGALHALADRQQLLEDRGRVTRTPRSLVGTGEVVAGAERVGVLGALDALEIFQQRFVDRDRVRDAPRVLVGVGSIESSCGKPG